MGVIPKIKENLPRLQKKERLNNVFSVKIRWKLLKEAKSLLTWGEVSLIQQPLITSSVRMSIGQRRNVIMPINNSMCVCIHVCLCVCFCVWYYVLFDWAGAQLCSKSPWWIQHTLARGVCPLLHSMWSFFRYTLLICLLHSYVQSILHHLHPPHTLTLYVLLSLII